MMGERRFLMLFVFLSIVEILKIASSICTEPVLESWFLLS